MMRHRKLTSLRTVLRGWQDVSSVVLSLSRFSYGWMLGPTGQSCFPSRSHSCLEVPVIDGQPLCSGGDLSFCGSPFASLRRGVDAVAARGHRQPVEIFDFLAERLRSLFR